MKPIEAGLKSTPKTVTVTEERLQAFCAAVGAKYRGFAPPTFLTVCREGEFDLLADMGIRLAQAIHADQEYTYEEPILPGDVLKFESTLAKVLEKRGSSGAMKFLVFETQLTAVRSGRSLPAGSAKSTIMVRQ